MWSRFIKKYEKPITRKRIEEKVENNQSISNVWSREWGGGEKGEKGGGGMKKEERGERGAEGEGRKEREKKGKEAEERGREKGKNGRRKKVFVMLG